MHRMRLIPQIFHIKCHALTGCLLENGLIRILSRSEEIQIHGAVTLKLRIRRSGTHRRNTQITRWEIPLQEMKHRDGISLYRIVLPQKRIKKGFQLQHNDIRVAAFYVFCIFGLCLLFAFQFLHSRLVIALRFLNSGIQK